MDLYPVVVVELEFLAIDGVGPGQLAFGHGSEVRSRLGCLLREQTRDDTSERRLDPRVVTDLPIRIDFEVVRHARLS